MTFLPTPRDFDMSDSRNEKVMAHWNGLSHELKTGEIHSCPLCTPINTACDNCGKPCSGMLGWALHHGWKFDIGEESLDLCSDCYPMTYTLPDKPHVKRDWSGLTARLNEIRKVEDVTIYLPSE